MPIARRSLYSLVTLALVLAVPAGASATELRPAAATGDGISSPKEALSDAIHAKAGQSVRGQKLDVTLALHNLTKQLPSLHGADKRRADALFARPTSEDTANPNEETYAPGTKERSICGTHFCVHWVDTTEDAPVAGDANGNGIPDYVETMLGVFENVYNVENVQLGWKPAKSDGKKGGNSLVDVYIKNVGPDGIFGYSAPDAGQKDRHHQYAYLVMDNDYSQSEFPRYPNYLEPMEVTAAHEYNHVLQFNYDTNEDTWMFESTATWMEDKVYDDINDYVQYLTPWATFSTIPLTMANSDDNNLNNKIYGDAVWNRWIDRRFGADVVRRAWEVSVDEKSFAPGAYDKAIKEKGSTFFDAFVEFAADTAEWNVGDQLFEEGATYPDMKRAESDDGPINLTPDPDPPVTGPLDHTAYALVNVDPKGQQTLNVSGAVPDGTKGAVALVTRTGPQIGGTANVQIAKLPHGGRGTLSIQDPSQFSRITAVIINADISKSGYSSDLGDWVFKKDKQGIDLSLNDTTPPTIVSRAPGTNKKGVSTTSKVSVKFSEVVLGANAKTVRLTGPGGKTVKVRIANSGTSGVTKLKLGPTKRLKAHTKYTVKVGALVDAAGNKLTGANSWSFTTE